MGWGRLGDCLGKELGKVTKRVVKDCERLVEGLGRFGRWAGKVWKMDEGDYIKNGVMLILEDYVKYTIKHIFALMYDFPPVLLIPLNIILHNLHNSL